MVWTIASGDDALGQVYLPPGQFGSGLLGSLRSGLGTYSTALVALDVTTGDVVWRPTRPCIMTCGL